MFTRYTINDLEKITGIKAHTIRMWEKRYNAVEPERSATNIRYYKDCDLKKLLNISTLNKHGIKISHIIKMCPEEIKDKIIEITTSSSDFDSHINNLVVSMIEINEEGFEKILSTIILKFGFEKAVTHILFPFLEKIGILWITGAINPGQEHFITHLIRQKLIVAIDGQVSSHSDQSRTFLMFLPEQELHELGLLYYSYIIKKNGHRIIYLGQSVPYRDVIEVTSIRKVDCLFTYFVSGLSPDSIPDYLQKMSNDLPGKKIFITGIQLRNLDFSVPENVVLVKNTENFKQFLSDQ